jgi:hypothetical protein
MGHKQASQSLVPGIWFSIGRGSTGVENLQNERFNATFRVIVKRRSWLIEKQYVRLVGQCSCERDALGLSPGEVCDVASRVTVQAHTCKQRINLPSGEDFAPLAWTKLKIVRHCSGKEEWPLGDHPYAAAKLAWWQGSIVDSK